MPFTRYLDSCLRLCFFSFHVYSCAVLCPFVVQQNDQFFCRWCTLSSASVSILLYVVNMLTYLHVPTLFHTSFVYFLFYLTLLYPYLSLSLYLDWFFWGYPLTSILDKPKILICLPQWKGERVSFVLWLRNQFLQTWYQ